MSESTSQFRAASESDEFEAILAGVEAIFDEAGAGNAAAPQKIHSTLPLDVPEFREIVVQFVDGLPQMLKQMRESLQAQDFSTLRELAHKLKGTGGTVGFADFTQPSETLQHKAESQTIDGSEELLNQLEAIANAIEIPNADA